VHKKQLLTYLRLADKRLGLLINFNVGLIKDGITWSTGWKNSFAQRRRARRKNLRKPLKGFLCVLRVSARDLQNIQVTLEYPVFAWKF
jgi:PD-(D/E)XK nuclease superfamily